MNKENLIKKISKEAGIKKDDSKGIFNRVIELMSKEIKKGKEVTIENFGEFKIVRNEMRIILKKKNNKIVYPPKDTIVFRPDSKLTDKLNTDE